MTENFTIESRKQKFFIELAKPKTDDKILNLGVNPFCGIGMSLLEPLYQYQEKVLTTNRWLPVDRDNRTLLLFIHWLHKKLKLYIKNYIELKTYWVDEKNLNLLSAKKFSDLFPKQITIELYKQKILLFTSSLIVIWTK